MPTPNFSLPEGLFDRLFNFRTGTLHSFYCETCGEVTEHFSTTHSALTDNDFVKFLTRILLDYTALGNVIVGKPYICTACERAWFE